MVMVATPLPEDTGGLVVDSGVVGKAVPVGVMGAPLVVVQFPAAISLPNWATTWAMEAVAAWIPDTSSEERLLPVARIFVNPCNICATCERDASAVMLQDPPLFVVGLVGTLVGATAPVIVGTMEKDADPVVPDGVKIVIV